MELFNRARRGDIRAAYWALPLMCSLLAAGGVKATDPTDSAVTASPYALRCHEVRTPLQQALLVNIYTVTGFAPANPGEPGSMEVTGVQLDIDGESGQASRQGNRSTDLGPDWTTLVVKVDEERSYAGSTNTYKIQGTLTYAEANLQKLADYLFTVTGGGFGSSQPACRKAGNGSSPPVTVKVLHSATGTLPLK